jgi:hypothetical protein
MAFSCRFRRTPIPGRQRATCATLLGSANDRLSWCLVRPDALTDAAEVTPYSHQAALFPGIFDGQKRTSRINTAHFMAQLAADPEAFAPYAGKMPTVIDTDSLPLASPDTASGITGT